MAKRDRRIRLATEHVPVWAAAVTPVLTLVLYKSVGGPGDEAAILSIAVVCSGIVVGASAIRSAREERRSVDDSQRRLTAAEQALEDALRGRGALHIEHFTGELRLDDVRAGADLPHSRVGNGPSVNGSSLTEDGSRATAGLALAELWAATHARLDHYHQIATGQAQKSFRNAQLASGMGFALLVAFVVVALNAGTTTGSIVSGGLGAVSAALAGYVSRTFVRSQEASAGHLRSYFDQPLEMSRYLAAERLVADVSLGEARRAEVVTMLVQAMVSGPAPGEERTGDRAG